MTKVSDLLERAKSATDLDDFGDDSFLEGLDVLTASVEREAQLNELGREFFEGTVTGLLIHRLQIGHWFALHPEIDEQEIVAPLIGLGAPRTGSTALSCMLGQDPSVRCLRTWESQAPCPPPEKATEDTDPRIAQTAEQQKLTETLFPRIKSMLPLSPTEPTECQNLMGYDFKSQVFLATFKAPDYFDWLLNKADLVPTYRYVKRVLKLLQWRCPPNRWRLKNPSHSPFVEALDEVFPDARFWTTHRSISEVMPSVVDLFNEMSSPFTDHLDRAWIVRENVEWWECGLKRLAAFRDAGNEHRFFDIRFADFQRDPLAEIESLYAFLEEPLTDETRRRMLQWRKDMPRSQNSGKSRDPVALGIDMAQLDRQFDFYTARFGLDRSASSPGAPTGR